VPFAGYILALMLPEQGLMLSVVTALLVSALIGLVNGLLTVGLGAPSFIVTLGTLGILEGLARWITNTTSVLVSDDQFVSVFGKGSGGLVSSLVLWSIGALIVGHII